MTENSTDLVDRWRGGDQDAATQLHQRYGERLVMLARKRLSNKFQGRLDPEDVVQSVFRTMFRRTQAGSFEFQKDDDFWKLMVTITLNKVRNKVRGKKRDPDRERNQFDDTLAAVMCRDPGTLDLVAFTDFLGEIQKRLSPIEQQLLTLRLEGYTQEEIAEQNEVDVRTVRRRLTSIREKVSTMAAESGDINIV